MSELWHEYVNLPETRFFIKWWWVLAIGIVLFSVLGVLLSARSHRRSA